jgi:hypothetical protein
MKLAQLAPSWLLLGKDGYPYIYVTDWKNDRDKFAAEMFIRLKIVEHDVVMYSFVGEAHIRPLPADYKEGDPIDKDKLPRGEEIVSAVATDGATKLARTWLIIRDEQSGQVKALEDQGQSTGIDGGWVDSLLDQNAT